MKLEVRMAFRLCCQICVEPKLQKSKLFAGDKPGLTCVFSFRSVPVLDAQPRMDYYSALRETLPHDLMSIECGAGTYCQSMRETVLLQACEAFTPLQA